MKLKLALALMAAVGSAALVAAAQTPSPSGSSDRQFYFRTTPVTATSGAPYVAQDVTSGVTVAAPTRSQSSGASAAGSGASARGGSYSLSNVFFVSGEEAGIAHEADQLARQLGEAKSDSERDKLKAKLGEALEKQFEQRQKRHETEIAELEAQVKKLKDLVSRRQENRREIIARRLEQVQRESQGLGW
jgi:hypothetical protein